MLRGPETSVLVGAVVRRLPRSRGAEWVALAFLLLLALWLRLYRLGSDSLWTDEIASVGFARLSWAALFGPIAALEPTPPTYYALLKAWIALVPVREFTLRLPSALAGAAAVPLLFLFARRAFGWQGGIVAGLLLALAPMQIALAQNARVYAFVLLAFAAGLVCAQVYVAAPKAPQGRRALAGLALSSAALPSLHATGLFAIAALGVYIAVAHAAGGRAGIRALAPPALMVLGGVLPAGWWYLGAVAIARDPNSPLTYLQVPDLEDVAIIFRDTFVSPTGRTTLLFTAIAVVAGTWAIVAAVRRRDPHALGILAALAFVLLAMPLVSQIRPVLIPRTLAFAVALLTVLLAAGAVAIPGGWPRALAVLLLLVSAVRGTADYFVHGGVHQPFRETVALLERMVQPDEPVVVTDAFDAVAIEHYGNGRPVRLLAAVDPTIRLEREVVRLMSSAVLVDPSEPCRALVAEPRVWVLAYPGYRPRLAVQVAEALAAAGGRAVAVPAVASEFRSLVRWDGVECRASTP